MRLILAIALGGAIGAIGRHYTAGQMMKMTGGHFPWGTLTVNILGSFAMGALIELMALKWSVGQEMRAFLTVGRRDLDAFAGLAVGMLGAFTTFSTFSLDVALLSERGQTMLAFAYVAVSVLASIAALFAGLHLFRHLLS